MIEIIAIFTLLLVIVGLLLLADDHRKRHPGPVRKHRAGQVDEVERDHTPLPAWERLRLAPTHNDPDVFVPQAQIDDLDRLGETRPLVAPKRREDMRQTLRHLAANENATEAERALAEGLLNVHEQEATQ